MRKLALPLGIILALAFAERPQRQRLEYMPRSEFTQLPTLRHIIDTAAIDFPLLEAALFHYTNAARARRGKKALQYNADLWVAAQGHSQSMEQRNYFSHQNKYNRALRSPADRVLEQNNTFTGVGENLAQSSLHNLNHGESFQRDAGGKPVRKNGEAIGFMTYRAFAKKVVQMWLDSKQHRANIMSPFEYMACGVSKVTRSNNGLSELYITQNFGNL